MIKYLIFVIVEACFITYLCRRKNNLSNQKRKERKKMKRFVWVFFMWLFVSVAAIAQGRGMLSGKILSNGKPLTYATARLKGTAYGSATNEEGIYHIKAPAGNYTLVVTAVGHSKEERKITITDRVRTKMNIILKEEHTTLDEVTVVSKDINRVRKSAYNVVAVDTKDFQNTSKTLSDALQKLPGMKIRETGGVGSDMNMALDGYSGRHVKVFIDGVPQEGVGSAFSLNNIPVNFAERIEVYRGVVPVGFGTDAIGGVINVVTKKKRRRWFADASYSYGSFNTHKAYVNFGQTLRNGFTYEVNAFRNYSDNSYKVNTYVQEFTRNPDGSVTFDPLDTRKTYDLKRFNDRYHNETVIGKAGFTGKSWADRILLGFNYSHMYKQIQTGVRQEIVFGDKFRKGYSLMPSLEYFKRNLFTKGLDVVMTANYNHNIVHNVDTSSRGYNWRGEYWVRSVRGEQSYQNGESKNANWNGTVTFNYRPDEAHLFTFNHVLTDFKRTSRAYDGDSPRLTDYTIPKITRKNISGLSYRYMPSGKWNVSAFGKYYRQYNEGPVSLNSDGVGNYVNYNKTNSTWGYGAAGTYYILKDLQMKLSYEKAYRLPTTDELFGDEDMEAGKTDLKPEKSHNFNLNLNYGFVFARKHRLYAEGSLIYRDTRDYIKRGLDRTGGISYGIYENHGHVKTKGYNVTLRYNYSRWVSAGATYNSVDTRDYEKTWTGTSQQENLHYKVRLPNLPYRYANWDAGFNWHGLFSKGNVLTVTYDGMWQHDFPLYWENIGAKDSKQRIPEQLSHNITLTYAVQGGRYNFSLECRNLTGERLYDNFSLQKAGRAFYGKVRVYLDK